MKYLGLISILALLLSCAPEKNKKWTVVNAHVYNKITGEPVDDVDCYVNGYSTGLLGLADRAAEGSPVDGQLELSFLAKSKYRYYMYYRFGSEYWYDYSNRPDIIVGQENNLDIPLVKNGLLIINSSNINCYDQFDALSFKLDYENEEAFLVYNHYWNTGNTLDGCYDNYLYNQELPAGDYQFHWLVTRANGADSSGVVNLYLGEQDTLDYTFQY